MSDLICGAGGNYSWLYEKRPEGWYETLEAKAMELRALKGYWARHHAGEMDFDEFMLRRGLRREVNNHRMDFSQANKILRDCTGFPDAVLDL